ncbi:MAG TPA: type VI secretion system membrane subunit TssM, partial [Blastocatellia bacterium]
MSDHWQQLKSTVGLSALVSFYGVVSLIVWFLGPSVGLGGETERVIIIALILLTWPFAILITSYRKKREERLAAGGNGSGSVTTKPAKDGLRAPARGYDEITRGTEETVKWLRGTKLGAARSGDAVYSLPWFVVAGPPASGKTSLLLSSNLDFQVVRGQRSADQNVVRPTRDCEWRVTDWAVLLDTAGRYQTEGPDSDEWSALIETIKKYRKARPLDGFLIAVDASRLLASGEADIEQQAKVLRSRLDEVIARTQLRFPVYLVFTHMESIEGFDVFFADLDAGEQGQAWGATIPLEQSQNAHALFDVEFDYLYEALMRRRLMRLSSARRPDEQLYVFDFPLSFGEARGKLGLFTSALFRPNPFSESPFLRGFYFTSSAPDNHLSGYAAGSTGPTDDEEGRPSGARLAGNGYFTESLFRDVLLRDKDLAASFQAGKKRPERLRNIIVGAGAAFLIILAFWVISLYLFAAALVNETRVVGANVVKYSQADGAKDAAREDAGLTPVELTALDSLRQKLEAIDKYNGRLGSWLFSVNSVSPYARAIYFDAVNYRLFKPAVAAIESDLQTFSAGKSSPGGGAATPSSIDGSTLGGAGGRAAEFDDGHYYDLLKAYLMLSNPAKTEPTFLESQLQAYWKKLTPQGADDALLLKQLEYYARHTAEEEAPHIKSSEKLVTDAQERLRAYPIIERVYKNIKTEIDSEIPAVTIESILQRSGRAALVSSAKVPGSFTLKGYNQYMSRIESAAGKVKEDAWVMGPYAGEVAWQASDTPKLKDRYLSEYVEQWKAFLKGVGVPNYSNVKEAEETLDLMAKSNSPILEVAKEAAKQTNLAKAPAGGFFSWVASWFSSSKSKEAAASVVALEFGPLDQFVSTDDESKYRTGLKQLQEKLYNKTPDQLNKDSKALTDTAQAVLKLLAPLATKSGSREAAALLRQPIERFNELLNLSDYQDIKRIWADQLAKKAQDLQAKFPFADSGEDARLGDLAAFLNPADGHLSVFVKNYLAGSFDAQWKIKENATLKDKFSDEFKKYLGDAY